MPRAQGVKCEEHLYTAVGLPLAELEGVWALVHNLAVFFKILLYMQQDKQQAYRVILAVPN